MSASRYLEERKHGQEVRYNRQDMARFYDHKELLFK